MTDHRPADPGSVRLRRWLHRNSKRVLVATVGFVVLLIGLAMVPLPGPALLVIPAGLAILATQFRWARRLLDAVRARTGQAVQRFRHHDRPAPVADENPQEDDARHESGIVGGHSDVA